MNDKIVDIIIPDDEDFKINPLILLIGMGSFLLIVLAINNYQNIPNVEINPFLLISITIVPLMMIGFFTKKYVQSKSIHIFTPGGYFWSTLMLNVKTVLLPITNRDSKSVSVYYLIIPLGGGAIPNWLPYFGGGRDGFMVVNKRLVIDLGGNVFVAGTPIKITVNELFPTLRKEVMSHKLFKGNPDKVPIYYVDLSMKVRDSDLGRENTNNEHSKLTTVGEIRQRYLSNIQYSKYLEEEVANRRSIERALNDALNNRRTIRREREDENNNENDRM